MAVVASISTVQPMLDDGDYDALVIDAEEADGDAPHDDRGAGGTGPRPATVVLELTLVAGPHKGHVVRVRASGLGRPALDLLGLPATLHVIDGQPSVALDQ